MARAKRRSDALPKWTQIVVVWEDAFADHDSHKSEDFVREYIPCIRNTVGYVLDDTHPDRIFIGSTKDRPDPNDADGTDTCEINVIPRGMIREIAVLTKEIVSRR